MMEERKEKLSERFLSCDLLFIKDDVNIRSTLPVANY